MAFFPPILLLYRLSFQVCTGLKGLLMQNQMFMQYRNVFFSEDNSRGALRVYTRYRYLCPHKKYNLLNILHFSKNICHRIQPQFFHTENGYKMGYKYNPIWGLWSIHSQKVPHFHKDEYRTGTIHSHPCVCTS